MKPLDLKELLTILLLCVIAMPLFPQTPNKTRVIAYYSGSADLLDNFDVTQMTHLIFCFGQLEGNRYKVSKTGTATVQKMVSLKKKNPNLKVLLSLGGAGGCKTCSDAFSTDIGRKEFAESVKEFHESFGTDGLDLDWEYPGIEQHLGQKYSRDDVKNFTFLVKELKKTGPKYEVSFAAGIHKGIFESTAEWKEVMELADFVNLMTYDLGIYYNDNVMIPEYAFRNSLNAVLRLTPHHSALYSTPEQKRSVDFAVKYLLNLGVPAEKLIVGAAFYGRMYASAGPENNGLYQPAEYPKSVRYRNMATQVSSDSGWIHHWDDVVKVPYAYNASKKLFITYEDKRSIELKTKYVIDNKLGGIMFWQLGHDADKDGLLDAIHKVKRNYIPVKK